jgi:ATP-dependent Zn protease
VRDLLTEHRDQLDLLAEALLQHETLDTDDAYEAVGLQRPSKQPVLSDEPALLGG